MHRVSALITPLCALALGANGQQFRTLIVDGQNNHAWQETTPILKRLLEESGRFSVEIATTPPKGGDMNAFRPRFSDYKLVVSNYNGDSWSSETKAAFETFVEGGGGFVSFHAADNAFPEWRAYNEMIGVGGWGGRNENSGSYARFRDGRLVIENKPGAGGHHGKRHEFLIETRNAAHPIARGLPPAWMHAQDELYDSLRGPAARIDLIATAFSAPETGGTGEHEPMLFAIPFGKGRVFHTTLGHDAGAMRCVGFITTLQRGAEWAATGKVTLPAPDDFPDKTTVRIR
jgi:uncharacterized protein